MCASLATLTAAHAAPSHSKSPALRCTFDGLQPVLLTISGPGVQPNRTGLDPKRDIMLAAQGHQFDAAWVCGRDAINSLPQTSMNSAIEYDDQRHELRGPLLETVLQASGLDISKALAENHWITLQAIDGYRVQMPLTQALRWRYLLATQMDGQALPLGGLGPLWAMFDPQTLSKSDASSDKKPFTQAAWGLYYIRISAEQPKA